MPTMQSQQQLTGIAPVFAGTGSLSGPACACYANERAASELAVLGS